jgi:hypothetical protein
MNTLWAKRLKPLGENVKELVWEKGDEVSEKLGGKVDSIQTVMKAKGDELGEKVDSFQAASTAHLNSIKDGVGGIQDRLDANAEKTETHLNAIQAELSMMRRKFADSEAQCQKDALATSAMAQLLSSNKDLTNKNNQLMSSMDMLIESYHELSTSNRTLRANSFVSQVGTSLGLLAADQKAQRLDVAHTEATYLLHMNHELSREKRTLEQDLDEATEELQRSRRRRTETPDEGFGHRQDNTYGHLTKIKIWTGTEEKDFEDLHLSVKDALRSFVAKHVLGDGWYDKAQKGKTSCARNRRMDRCKVPQDNYKVACSNCVGGKTFCIRRRADGDTTLSLFPLHPQDRANASIDDVGFWMTTARKTRPDFYGVKLYPEAH